MYSDGVKSRTGVLKLQFIISIISQFFPNIRMNKLDLKLVELCHHKWCNKNPHSWDFLTS